MRNRVGKMLQSLTLALVCTFHVTACDRADDPSSLKLTNAIEIDSAAFPAVVQLMTKSENNSRFCTGFFVNEYQVLTAAHCVKDLAPEQPDLYLVSGGNETSADRAAKALRYYVHDDFERGQGQLANPYDIAVVEFPAGTALDTLRLSRHAPRENDAVILVGYGSDQNVAGMASHASGTTTGAKRYGQNSIKGCGDGILSVVGVARTRPGLQKGQYVATAQGDSGGPILMNTEVVGMMVAVDVRQGGAGQVSSISYAIDLSSPSSREFLNRVLD
ncbi:trypsin-like serine protease [Oligoflexus tunisiensis]|uniref:trypsin-like serine protease n=1 Tax=Oligoflexus tunisiensis TaxID=708132 RepID=UPI00159F24E1|nr:trypsin-like serine protease [Oligoflexus tunisiensis]